MNEGQSGGFGSQFPQGFPQQNLQPISSGSGDIVLGNSKPLSNKPRRGIVIGVFVVLILIIAAFLVFFFNNRANDFGSDLNDAKTAFNRFASYIIDGEENDNFPVGEYRASSYYALDRAIFNQDEDYFIEADELFNKFLKNITPEPSSLIEAMINGYVLDWAVINAYVGNHFYGDEAFLNYYFENGWGATKERIENEYQALSAIKDEEIKSIAEAYLAYGNHMLSLIDMAKEAGCIINEVVDEKCVNAISLSQEQEQNIGEILENRDDADQAMDRLVRYFIQDLWTIERLLNDE